MLCDKCLNRTICKYFTIFADAPMVINIESCEKAKFNEVKSNDVFQPKFKKPIDYSKFDIPQEEEEIEDEEKVFVDLSQPTEEKETSIMDLLLEGEDDGK